MLFKVSELETCSLRLRRYDYIRLKWFLNRNTQIPEDSQIHESKLSFLMGRQTRPWNSMTLLGKYVAKRNVDKRLKHSQDET